MSVPQVYYNDNDPFSVRVLRSRIRDETLPAGYVDPRNVEDVDAASIRHFHSWHLFAGIGGFPLGLEWAGWPRHLRTLTGGFPCQDLSFAGKGAGLDGARSGLWWQMHRLIRNLRPDIDIVILENVSALLVRGVDVVLGSLAEIGFDAEWHCIPASYVGAPHRRDRIWIVAYPYGEGQPGLSEHDGRAVSGAVADAAGRGRGTQRRRLREGEPAEQRGRRPDDGGGTGDGGHAAGQGLAGRQIQPARQEQPAAERADCRAGAWRSDPADDPIADLGGISHGLPAGLDADGYVPRTASAIPDRVERLKSLGNAVVPQVVEFLARRVMEAGR
jgi:DNA (cytosine-5)-methyltransferase 1